MDAHASGLSPRAKSMGARDRGASRLLRRIGAFLVTIWLGIFFLLMLGFGYSYFWSASTIIYLLMRRHVDAAELDEVYLEEDEQEGPYGGHFTPPIPPTSSAVKPPSSVTMVEAPTLRTPPAAPPPPPPPPASVAAPPSPVISAPSLEPPRSAEPPPAPPSLPGPSTEDDQGAP